MERTDSRLQEILIRFWNWAGYDAADFSADGFTCADEKEPFYFPELMRMRTLCCVCEDGEGPDAEIDDYLTCMALDNEVEDILSHCADHAPDSFIERIARRSLSHPQWNARWQAAELLYRREVPEREALLTALARDPHPYVRQRARNSLEYLKS